MNNFGRIFNVSIFGESHGEVVGVVIDGVKSGIKLDSEDFFVDFLRRRSGILGTTERVEEDLVHMYSGVYNGYTTGSPIMIKFDNKNVNSKCYEKFLDIPRPSHADYVGIKKYNGFNDYRGGGAFSGRLTVGIVAAGVIAKKMIPMKFETKIINLHGETDPSKFDEVLTKAKDQQDSVGGIVEIKVTNMPVGLGEPYFDSLESVVSHALYSIGGVKGVEFGVGFDGVKMNGSEFNDRIIDKYGKTETNNNGGINGGISNGNDLLIRVFVKPTSSIGLPQKTFNLKTNEMDELVIEGRHDVAIILRSQVVLEASVAISLCDLFLINEALK